MVIIDTYLFQGLAPTPGFSDLRALFAGYFKIGSAERVNTGMSTHGDRTRNELTQATPTPPQCTADPNPAALQEYVSTMRMLLQFGMYFAEGSTAQERLQALAGIISIITIYGHNS